MLQPVLQQPQFLHSQMHRQYVTLQKPLLSSVFFQTFSVFVACFFKRGRSSSGKRWKRLTKHFVPSSSQRIVLYIVGIGTRRPCRDRWCFVQFLPHRSFCISCTFPLGSFSFGFSCRFSCSGENTTSCIIQTCNFENEIVLTVETTKIRQKSGKNLTEIRPHTNACLEPRSWGDRAKRSAQGKRN